MNSLLERIYGLTGKKPDLEEVIDQVNSVSFQTNETTLKSFEVIGENKHFRKVADVQKHLDFIENHCEDITEFTLSNNEYSSEALEKLLEALQECPNVNKAKITNIIPVWDEFESPELIEVVSRNLLEFRELEEIDLSHNKLPGSAIQSLGFLLQNSSNIKILKLDSNNLGTDGAMILGEIIEQAPELKLEQISLSKNMLEDHGAIELAPNLSSIETLKQINLSDNEIRTEGIAFLSRNLLRNAELEVIDLSGNYIYEEEAISGLCQAFYRLRNIKVVNLSDCFIQNQGCVEILESLEDNSDLKHLNLSYNELDNSEVHESIQNLLSAKRELVRFT